ncbi:MAG: YmdB family metallophosphoesterase, partial [Oscillospiraceae bacterium]
DYYTETDLVLMPANHPAVPTKTGACTLGVGNKRVDVFNLSGVAFMENYDNPFKTLDELLKNSDARFKILDFHAESTAEKRAMAFYADGKLSAMFGTHTHVPTADGCIMPKKMGYITDVGMTGAQNSVIGVVPSLAIQKQMLHTPVKFEVSPNDCEMDCVLFTLDDESGKCIEVKQIFEK